MTRYTETRPKHETTRPRNPIREYEKSMDEYMGLDNDSAYIGLMVR